MISKAGLAGVLCSGINGVLCRGTLAYFRRNIYKELGQEKLAELIELGNALVEQHGEDDLQYKLKSEKDMAAVGAYLDWKTATNDENYEDPS